MARPAIRVERLGKLYHLGARLGYRTLREALAEAASAPLRYLRAPRGQAAASNGHDSEIAGRGRAGRLWAVRDLSFDVPHGEVVGVVGRNGAGKTTLLKMLSRITAPTEGYAELRGRVGSLLEVGTGFHPELTGRENVYMNGAIIGMRRHEIARRFDEIVAFAEVERFLDTPVKRYSSGMYVRLAFAVAAHLEPDILLVDEVLAVGDLQFQKKCLGKMSEVAKGGRTVVFISHQLTQIRRLCDRVLWLDGGRLRASGGTASVLAQYESAAAVEPGEAPTPAGGFVKWDVVGSGHVVRDGSRPVTFRVVVRLDKPIAGGHFGFHVVSDGGLLVGSWAFEGLSLAAGTRELLVDVPSLPIRPGSYSLMCSLFDRGNNLTGGDLVEVWHGAPRLSVESRPMGHPQDEWAGVLNLPARLGVGSGTRAAD
jgi:ABC-type polysaccharide/polyol phosphate transport system ATPase subunit